MKSGIAALIATVVTAARVIFPASADPIALTDSSFDVDIVVEASAIDDPVAHFSAYVNATMDAGVDSLAGFTFFEQGLDPSNPAAGLPADGGPFASHVDPATVFQFRPYTANNARLLDATHRTAALTLAAPQAYARLSFLATTAYATSPTRTTVTAIFNDGAPPLTLGYVDVRDWCSLSYPPEVPYAFAGASRVYVPWGFFQSFPPQSLAPCLYQADLFLPEAAQAHPIASLSLSFDARGNHSAHTAFMALSGIPVPEPATLVLLCPLALCAARRRR